jgi:putative ABC transport system permease protein
MDRPLVKPTKASHSWLWKMAWRDSRRSRSRLLLFTSSIILGISALVAINAFRNSLFDEINNQAKTLLGADLVIESNKPVSEDLLEYLDSLGSEKSKESAFASMIYFPRTDGSRLVQVRALEGNFPYYGEIGSMPQNAAREFQGGKFALVDQTLMLQYNVNVGDIIRVGTEEFEITGKLEKVPGQSGITASVAPVVYIPYRYLETTGLVQRGSRINYNFYYKYDAEVDATKIVDAEKEKWKSYGLGHETIEERKKSTGETFANLTNFLNLVAFVALLLGCVGVASAVHIYVKEKIAVVSLLRCLGVTGMQAFQIYLYQILVMGLIGSLIGAVLGSLMQGYLPQLLKDFIPLSMEVSFSWQSLGEGILLGTSISILFALLPLLSVRNVSPLRAIRAGFEETKFSRDWLVWAASLALGLFIFGFAWMQIKEWKVAFFFTLGLLFAFGVLTGMAKLVTVAVRNFAPTGWSYVWRQGLANLYRPQNQTLILITTIGLGTALITTLYFVQELLVDKVSISASGDRPNMVLFDIQSEQKDEISQLTIDYDMPVIQEVPVITMRMMEIKGITLAQARADSTLKIPNYAFNREYRVTYRDNLIDSEVLKEGKWQGKVESPSDSIFVSLSQGYAENLNLKIGDELLFNVQGALVKTYVGSFRDVDWNRVQTNFLVVFPTGVLEKAPQFHVLITRTDNPELAARYQQAIVRSYPNISIVNLELILQTLDDILGKVAFVIRFMAIFSIITGLLVLAGSVMISKYQRIQESVLLRTLGAVKWQVYKITAMEYFILGSLASLVGIFLSLGSSWALAYFTFEAPFLPSIIPMIVMFVLITLLTMVIGLANSRSVVTRPPLEILRNDI